jgi:hypothetical protein
LLAVAPMCALVPLLTACAAPGGTFEGGRLRPDERGTRIERSGRLAGTLIVRPASVEPGMTLSVAVKNVGEVTMFYGLGNRIERRMDGRWEDATADVYGTANPAFRLILLSARPGERAGPRHNAVGDRIPVPRSLARGVYRVVKVVSGDQRGGPPRLTLHATFEVQGTGARGR